MSYSKIKSYFHGKMIDMKTLKKEKKKIIEDLLTVRNLDTSFDVELFGIDFIVSEEGRVFLLELNENPDQLNLLP